MEKNMGAPCSSDPDKWFGYPVDLYADERFNRQSHVNATAILEAKMVCLTACSLAGQRRCAQEALDSGAEFGVWAGVELPGATYRKRPELIEARDVLAGIADGRVLELLEPA